MSSSESSTALRRVCLYGGSFNPPHHSHVWATAWALGALEVDEVWWIPTYEHAFGKELVRFDERVKLCTLAIAPFGGRAQVCEVEADIQGTSYTAKTLRVLRAKHPDIEFHFLIGSDLVDTLPRWRESAELPKLATFHVIGRQGEGQAQTLELPAISSTMIREALAAGRSEDVIDLVPRAVWHYLNKERLYVP